MRILVVVCLGVALGFLLALWVLPPVVEINHGQTVIIKRGEPVLPDTGAPPPDNEWHAS